MNLLANPALGVFQTITKKLLQQNSSAKMTILYPKIMTNTDMFFSWVRVRRSVTGISSTIELCSTLLILKVCYNVRIFCTVICLQTCQSLFWTQNNSQSSIYKKNIRILEHSSGGSGIRTRSPYRALSFRIRCSTNYAMSQ